MNRDKAESLGAFLMIDGTDEWLAESFSALTSELAKRATPVRTWRKGNVERLQRTLHRAPARQGEQSENIWVMSRGRRLRLSEVVPVPSSAPANNAQTITETNEFRSEGDLLPKPNNLCELERMIVESLLLSEETLKSDRTRNLQVRPSPLRPQQPQPVFVSPEETIASSESQDSECQESTEIEHSKSSPPPLERHDTRQEAFQREYEEFCRNRSALFSRRPP